MAAGVEGEVAYFGLGGVEGRAVGVVAGVEGGAAYFCLGGVEGGAVGVVAGIEGGAAVGGEGGDDEEDYEKRCGEFHVFER